MRPVTSRDYACAAQRQIQSADATSEYQETRCETSIGLQIARHQEMLSRRQYAPTSSGEEFRFVQRLRRRRTLGIRQSQPVYSEEQSSRLATGQRGTPAKFNHSHVGLFDRACAALL